MAAKKQQKSAETEATKGATAEPPKKRNEILNEDLIRKYLEREGLPTEGTVVEMADRLEAYFEHEHRKAGAGPEAMLDCEPSRRKDGSIPDDALGCFRSAPAKIDECPFCGMTDVVTTSPPKQTNEKKQPPAEKPSADEPAPKDDRTKEEAKADDKDGGAVVKTNAKKIRQGKGSKAAASLAAPALDTPEETAPSAEEAKPAPAQEEPADAKDDQPESGATAADLDREIARVRNAMSLAERTNALSFWEQGDALRTIHDRKLWTVVRNEADGSPVYRSFGEFTARAFDISQATAYSYKKIAEIFRREDAETLGFTRMKELVQAQDLPAEVFARIMSDASRRVDGGGEFAVSSRELRDLIAKEKRLLSGPPPAPASAPPATSSGSSSARDADSDEDSGAGDNNRVDCDDDGVVKEPAKNERQRSTPEPKTVTVSLAESRVVVPLYKKGSSVKPAKKLEDGAHGSFAGINGASVKVEIVIGEGAELQLVISIDRPR